MKCGIWRHYKGALYLVLGVGRHTETEERLVIYVPLYVREGPRIAARPYDDFNGLVEVAGERGCRPRFEFIGEEMPMEVAG